MASRVRVLGPVGRCAVTTHDPDTGVPMIETLRVLRRFGGSVPPTSRCCSASVGGRVASSRDNDRPRAPVVS